MTRQPKTPSELFHAGYEAGRAAKFREHAIELDKLNALTALLEARLARASARAEAAEKKLAKLEGKRKPKAEKPTANKEEAGGFAPGVKEHLREAEKSPPSVSRNPSSRGREGGAHDR